MAKDKTSFILYADQRSYFDKLSDEEAGRLIKHIFSYVNDENPNPIDRIIDLSFEPIKLQLKRDLKKYESIVERNKMNGKLGGRPSNPNKPKKPSGLIGNPDKPKKADTDTDNDNDTDNEINKDIPALKQFFSYAISKRPEVNRQDLKLKYDSWLENGWKDGNSKPIKNWKVKLLNTLPYIKDREGTTDKAAAAHMANVIRP